MLLKMVLMDRALDSPDCTQPQRDRTSFSRRTSGTGRDVQQCVEHTLVLHVEGADEVGTLQG